MLDDKDIQKLKSVFATKEDLSGFATKEDLSGFATKSDLSSLATKSDFNELKSDIGGLRSEFTSFRVETRENFEKLNEKIDDLTEVVMGNHDKRIEALEAKVFN